MLISTASRETNNTLGRIKVKLKSNSSHVMCNENSNREPEVVEKNSNNGKLLCQDHKGIYTSFNYKPIKL